MSQAPDTWYVRLPDGRVLRAASTHVVRHHIESGRIPLESRVRRSAEDEWASLDWTEEFTDLVREVADVQGAALTRREAGGSYRSSPATIASRLDPNRLRSVGLHGLAEELLAALDSTLARSKLLVAGIAGVLCSSLLAVAANLSNVAAGLPFPWSYSVWGGTALALVIIGVICTVLVTQMTYVELSRLRPARWVEARSGLIGFSLRLFFALAVAAGLPLGAIIFLRWFPGVLADMEFLDRFAFVRSMGADVSTAIAMILEIVLWPVLGFTLLLGPVLVIEECSVVAGIAQWWWLLRRHLGRLFLYESAAFLGGIATLVFAFPLALAAWGRLHHWGSLDTPIGFSLCLLAGMAAAPLITYLIVAHVFIYLSLRYGYEQRQA
jgi:hypothetical protein